MKKINLILILAGITVTCFGQNPVYEWARQLGGPGYSISNYIAVKGTTKVYSIGQFWGTGDFNPGPGTYNLTSAGDADIFISKLNDSGNFSWAKRIGSADYDAGKAIAIDGSNNIYITGYFYGTVDFDPGPGTYNVTSSGNEDIFVCKLNSAGDLLWVRKFGGAQYDQGADITTDAGGNVYTSGEFCGTVDFDPGFGTHNLISSGQFVTNTFISKLDASGNFVWAKNFYCTSSTGAAHIAIDFNGNLYATGGFLGTADFDPGAGTFNLTAPNSNAYIAKLDINGNFVWADQMGGGLSCAATSIAIDNSGNVITTGLFSDTADFDPGPGTFNLISNGLNDIFVLKTDSNGNLKWAKGFGSSTGYDQGRSIATDNAGSVYTTGWSNDTADFDPGPGTFILASSGQSDIFISKLDSSGNFIWAKEMGGSDYDAGNSIATDTLGYIWLTGTFRDTVDFNAPFSANLIASDDGNAFVAKYSQANTTGMFENVLSENFSIFPNPATGTIQLTLPKDVKGNIEIVNMMGEKVYEAPLPVSPKRGEESYATIDVSLLAKGIYVVKVGELSSKLVIE